MPLGEPDEDVERLAIDPGFKQPQQHGQRRARQAPQRPAARSRCRVGRSHPCGRKPLGWPGKLEEICKRAVGGFSGAGRGRRAKCLTWMPGFDTSAPRPCAEAPSPQTLTAVGMLAAPWAEGGCRCIVVLALTSHAPQSARAGRS